MMKIRLLLAGLALAAVASVAQAGPGLQYWQGLRDKQDFEKLEPGDAVVFVCSTCTSVSEVSLDTKEDIVHLHTAGGEVVCPACKKKLKTVLKTRRDEPHVRTEVVYVNEAGAEVAFIAKRHKK